MRSFFEDDDGPDLVRLNPSEVTGDDPGTTENSMARALRGGAPGDAHYKVMAYIRDGTAIEIADGTGIVPVIGDELRVRFPDGIFHLRVQRRVFDTETLYWEIFVRRETAE